LFSYLNVAGVVPAGFRPDSPPQTKNLPRIPFGTWLAQPRLPDGKHGFTVF